MFWDKVWKWLTKGWICWSMALKYCVWCSNSSATLWKVAIGETVELMDAAWLGGKERERDENNGGGG